MKWVSQGILPVAGTIVFSLLQSHFKFSIWFRDRKIVMFVMKDNFSNQFW